jgi:hypothetical protein
MIQISRPIKSVHKGFQNEFNMESLMNTAKKISHVQN